MRIEIDPEARERFLKRMTELGAALTKSARQAVVAIESFNALSEVRPPRAYQAYDNRSLIESLKWTAETFRKLAWSQHHDRGTGPFDESDSLKAEAAITDAIALVSAPPLVPGMVAWIKARARPVLLSEIREAFGDGEETWCAFDFLMRSKRIEARFPEERPNDSGRQFWEVID